MDKTIGEVIVIGDLKLRDDASLNEYERLGHSMYSIVSRLRGFLSIKSKASDGEELTAFRIYSEQALEAWRTHLEHVETTKREHMLNSTSTSFYKVARLSAKSFEQP